MITIITRRTKMTKELVTWGLRLLTVLVVCVVAGCRMFTID